MSEHERQHEHLEPLWTVRDVAAYLRTSVSWVYRESAAGALPVLRIGGHLRFSPAAMKAFALQQDASSRAKRGPTRG